MLHALALSATAFEFQLELDQEPLILVEGGMETPMFPSEMQGLVDMVDRLQTEAHRQDSRRPYNPCELDQAKTKCRDAACLKRYAGKGLSDSCATFLSAASQPMPSPEALPQDQGMFSYSYTDMNGKVHTESGKLSSAEGKRMQSEMQSMLDFVIPGFGSIFEEPEPPKPKPQRAPEPPRSSGHPCGQELTMCSEELSGSTDRDDLQRCLIAHYKMLSADCKCFMHQMMGDELEKQIPGYQAPAQPRMRTVAVMETDVAMPGEQPRRHRLTCALFMMMFFVSFILILRRLFSCCCAPKPKHVAFVPPEVGITVAPLVITKEMK